MFDKTITSDDNFLEMPSGSQLLYFHLSMNADDDGFVNNWKSVMKMIGAKEDDLKILVAKSYIIPFQTGVIVIKHWKINNYLRKDRYNPTRFQEEYNQLTLDNSLVYQVDTSGVHSIDKNSIDKNSIVKEKYCKEDFEKFYNAYPRKIGKANVEKWFIKNKPSKELMNKILIALEEHKKLKQWQDKQYIPHPTTWLNQKRWEDELDDKVKVVKSERKYNNVSW